MNPITRRDFLRNLGISAAAIPFVGGLPGMAQAASQTTKQRVIFMFSPNGVVPWNFWPEQEGADFRLKEILAPMEAYKDRMLVLNGVNNQVRGDGDNHMRGMSCLLTGDELLPGNIQGGSDTPAGWASSISIDQELKKYFQSNPETRTRFGSLEFGAGVPDRADPWTRMSYAGPNQPIAPVDDPYSMFKKLYGKVSARKDIMSVLDDVGTDLKKVRSQVSSEDRELLEKHATFVREMEKELEASGKQDLSVAPPKLKPGVEDENDNLPKLCRMQMDLLVNSFANDMARVATLQFSKSVGQARMRWLGIDEGHHSLSHDKDSNESSQEKLTKINKWFCQQLRYLVQKLDETPEPGSKGSMLDHTTVVWTNELGKGNSHTLNDIPFVLAGNGLGFRMGRSLKLDNEPHNRLLMSFAHAVGHKIDHFGKEDLCEKGALDLT